MSSHSTAYPPVSPLAWTDSQKSALVQQIALGALSLEQARARYGISADQLRDWVLIFRRSVRRALDQQLTHTLSIRGLDLGRDALAEFSGSLPDERIVCHDGLEARQNDERARLTRRIGPLGLLVESRTLVSTDFARSTGAPTTSGLSARARVPSASLGLSGRPPLWVLGLGALVCSSLGAVTAIAYADSVLLGRDSTDGSLDRRMAAVTPLNAGAAVSDCPDDMVMIDGGSFFMGSDSSHPALRWAHPAHPVTVRSFCLDRREITVEQYASCNRAGQCDPPHQNTHPGTDGDSVSADPEPLHAEQCNGDRSDRQKHPINCVSLHQAARYCESSDARLATEAEWEFAARGSDNRLFPWGNSQPSAEHLNACGQECAEWHRQVGLGHQLNGVMYEGDDGFVGSAPVGSFPLGATRDGVMDLIGNVFEWTSSGLYSYTREALVNPTGPRDADSIVIRGGSFNSGLGEFSDPALRFGIAPDSYSHAVGFRCASDPRTSGSRR